MKTSALAPTLPIGIGVQAKARGRSRLRKMLADIPKHALIIVVGMFFALPLLWMASTSFKSDRDVFHIPLRLLPYTNTMVQVNGASLPLYDVTFGDQVRQLALVSFDASIGQFVDPNDPAQTFADVQMKFAEPVMQVGFRWENYIDAMNYNPHSGAGVTIWTYLRNSLIICFFNIIGTVVSCALVAYGFARVNFPGRDILFVLVLGTMMLPIQAVIIPQYIMFNDILHWGNSFLPLIVPTFFANAWDIFLLRQFYRTIPEELCDAARIDGASEFNIFTKVIIPLSKPALAVVTITTFLFHWNDFQAPLIYLTSPENFTMALGLADFQGQRQILWNLLMAASVVFTVPIIIGFFFAQKQFIQGIKLTGMKE
jgi:multiple sugar transport system permease protein